MNKTVLIMPVFERPFYLKRCFESLAKANFEGADLMLINDGSKNEETIKIFNSFFINGVKIVKHSLEENVGVANALRFGLNHANRDQYENIVLLDSDTLIKEDFFAQIISTLNRFEDSIVSGFNSEMLDEKGNERHPVISRNENIILKKSVGGINLAFKRKTLNDFILQTIQKHNRRGENWDTRVCMASMKRGFPIVVLNDSVVQHIGLLSTLGHSERPDVAHNFFNTTEIKQNENLGMSLKPRRHAEQ